jgi:hypothetical protein
MVEEVLFHSSIFFIILNFFYLILCNDEVNMLWKMSK